MNVLFITWDNPKSNYLETLFFPIFKNLKTKHNIGFHVIQFGDKNKIETDRIATLSKDLGINYLKVSHFFHSKFSIFSLFKGYFIIRKFIVYHKIDTVISRSTMPSLIIIWLLNWLNKNKIKIVFDADGFPLEERVDFKLAKINSFRYQYLKSVEKKMIHSSERVLVRTSRAISIHSSSNKEFSKKFYKVVNGVNVNVFKFDPIQRIQVRKELGILENDLLYVFSGSLGPQYGWEEMLEVIRISQIHRHSKLLILTRYDFDQFQFPPSIPVIFRNPDFSEIPAYLSAADIAFNFRKGEESIKGVMPIKLGEYLSCGLPIITNSGIGDIDEILSNYDFCYFSNTSDSKKLLEWINSLPYFDRNQIRKVAVDNFSLTKATESYLKALL
jgi:glycosyltransferase involved in cell wall biosynthesis